MQRTPSGHVKLLLCLWLLVFAAVTGHANAWLGTRIVEAPVHPSARITLISPTAFAVSKEKAVYGYDASTELYKYLYTQGNPVNMRDPSGRIGEELGFGAGGWEYSLPMFQPRPAWPPRTPFPSQYLSKFDPGDYDKVTLDKGLDTMKDRFIQARDYLDRKGLVADGDASTAGSASCYIANEKVLQFMSPVPVGWLCFMDRAHDSIIGGWDENYIHCWAHNSSGTTEEAVFDWFDHSYHGNSGIFTRGNFDVFYGEHPYLSDQYPSVPAIIEKPGDAWQPKWDILDQLFNPTHP